MAEEAVSGGQEERQLNSVQLESVQWEEFTRAITFFQRHCPKCWFMYGMERIDHQHSECPWKIEDVEEEIQSDMKAWKEVIQWEAFAACFRCGLPAAVCGRFKRRPDGRFNIIQESRCLSIGVFRVRKAGLASTMKPMVGLWSLAYMYGPFTYSDQILRWMAAAKVDQRDKVAVGRWLSEKVEWEGQEASRVHQAFTWMWQGEWEVQHGVKK